MKKIFNFFRRAAEIFLAVLIVTLLIVTVTVMIDRSEGKLPFIFERTILEIVTDSMEPTLNSGDRIIIKKVDASELREGDIISFYSDDPEIYGKINTHRIAEITSEGDIITKGDAAPENDRFYADPDKIIGIFVMKLEVGSIVSQDIAFAVIIGIIAVIFIFETAEVISIIKNKDGEDK